MKFAIFNDFFQDNLSVNMIRKLGLFQFYNQNIINDEYKNYPGVRSDDISNIDKKITDYIISKIGNTIFQLSEESRIKRKFVLKTYYHITASIHQFGLIHRDSQSDFSGVIYLNPTPQEDSGTKFYVEKKPFIMESSFLNFFENANISQDKDLISSFCEEKSKFNNSNFEIDYAVENEYNKCILYPANYYHAPGKYFGQNLDDSRLCIVFFFYFED